MQNRIFAIKTILAIKAMQYSQQWISTWYTRCIWMHFCNGTHTSMCINIDDINASSKQKAWDFMRWYHHWTQNKYVLSNECTENCTFSDWIILCIFRWNTDDNRQIINDHRSRYMTRSNYNQPSQYSIPNRDRNDDFSFVNNDPGYTIKSNQRKIFRSKENPDEIYKNHPSFRNISRIIHSRVDVKKNQYPSYNDRTRYNERPRQTLKRRYENLPKSPNEIGGKYVFKMIKSNISH